MTTTTRSFASVPSAGRGMSAGGAAVCAWAHSARKRVAVPAAFLPAYQAQLIATAVDVVDATTGARPWRPPS